VKYQSVDQIGIFNAAKITSVTTKFTEAKSMYTKS